MILEAFGVFRRTKASKKATHRFVITLEEEEDWVKNGGLSWKFGSEREEERMWKFEIWSGELVGFF